jgi:DDE superfamily endonuclease
LLVCLGRRTISRSICVLGRQFQNWTPEYKLFSRRRWTTQSLFDAVLERIPELLSPNQPLVVALDDTPCRKTGKCIRAAKMLRDPLSPPYHLNLCYALRFLQAVLLVWPQERPGAARAIPVAFDLAPPVAKPKRPHKLGKQASRQDWAAYARAWRTHWKQMRDYRKRQREEGLSAQGARLLNQIAERCHRLAAWKDKILWAVVDASFCNQTVFRLLDPKIVLIGRVRKDIRLYGPVPQKASRAPAGRGRKPCYGPLLPTPEQLRQDNAAPWEKCSVFAAGKVHELNYKTLAPVFWRSSAAERPLRVLVIRPLRYRAHGHILYRQPAYLLVDNPEVPVAEALQAYFYRWEIEVDQKDEKDLLGVGQAQVWSDTAVERQPAFHVAAYAALLVAAIQAYGLNHAEAAGRLPLWRERKPPTRLSVAHLLANLRTEIEEYQTLQADQKHRKKTTEFLADAVGGHFGKKFPVTARAIMDSAWN